MPDPENLGNRWNRIAIYSLGAEPEIYAFQVCRLSWIFHFQFLPLRLYSDTCPIGMLNPENISIFSRLNHVAVCMCVFAGFMLGASQFDCGRCCL